MAETPTRVCPDPTPAARKHRWKSWVPALVATTYRPSNRAHSKPADVQSVGYMLSVSTPMVGAKTGVLALCSLNSSRSATSHPEPQ